ncbi:MAG: endonuclease/exonuclease/phosphatase family protein, partial [Cyanobacteria bacterium J06582_2]
MGETDEPKWHVVDKSKNNNKIEKMANKSNMNKKTKRGIRREGKCKENVLKKYCQLNVQGLITTNQPQEKVEILRDLMNEERPLFLALTETWLYEHKEAEVHIEDYTIYRKDRPLRREIGRRGRHVGGVALYIDSSWLPDSKEILGYSNSVVDVLAIYSRRENILIAVLYRQPERKESEEYRSTYKDFVEPLQKLEEAIAKYSNPETEIQILGDFNMPKADWDLGKHKEGADS